MKKIENRLKKLGMKIPEILLPAKEADLTKWSVVACDQYTSQPDYWAQVEGLIGSSPSTFHLIFPEIYLEEDDRGERIKKINRTMENYLRDGVLVPQKPGFVLVDRQTTHAPSRKGLMIAVDLEKYDYKAGSQSLIRATEGTVVERLPPRVRIRENACIELPHVMLLIDDAEKTVIEPLFEKAGNLEKLYDFDLMMDGMHIKGYKVDDELSVMAILTALEKLADPEGFRSRYGVGAGKGVLLFAVGDGNHSLASAKAHWENIKKALPEEDLEAHPSRYALVEVVNVHDDGLRFEPIHRVVFNTDVEKTLNDMVEYFNYDSEVSYKPFNTKEELEAEAESIRKEKGCHVLTYITAEEFGLVAVENPRFNLEVGTLQAFLDELIKENSSIKIDYIHGEDVVTDLGSKQGNIGFYLPPMDKHDLFKTVILDGVLPRKTFSMGEAEEKRFYLECRKIV